MTKDTMLAVLEASDRRRDERRRFLRYAGGISITSSLALLAGCGDGNDGGGSGGAIGGGGGTPTPTPTGTPTPTPVTDLDVLNFALNLEYLEAQFYSYAVYGDGLPSTMLTGQQTRGSVIGGRKVAFTDPVVAQYAREIAADEVAHVAFLRSALGNVAVAMPTINIDGGTDGAFTAAARAAGLVSSTGVFDPYASDENFLLGAFIFEDVGVTAYKGAAPIISNKTYLEAAAGILAAEAYHAGLVRTVLYAKGMTTPSLRTSTDKISDARDSLDGPSDDDQGISSPDGGTTSNIVPTDANGIAFSRSPGQVLNIAYLNAQSVMNGGFFPNGINGFVRTSAAN